jgi:hypothetical protein
MYKEKINDRIYMIAGGVQTGVDNRCNHHLEEEEEEEEEEDDDDEPVSMPMTQPSLSVNRCLTGLKSS